MAISVDSWSKGLKNLEGLGATDAGLSGLGGGDTITGLGGLGTKGSGRMGKSKDMFLAEPEPSVAVDITAVPSNTQIMVSIHLS